MQILFSTLRRVCLIPLLCLIGSTLAYAETLTVGVRAAKGDQFEYSYSIVFMNVLNAIGELTGDQFDFILLPPSRTKKYFIEGKIDIEPGVNPIWRQKEAIPGVYTIAFSRSNSILLFQAGKKLSFATSESDTDITIGTVRGFSYPTLQDKFLKGIYKRFDLVDENRLIKAILDARLNQVVVSQQFAETWLKHNAKPTQYEFGEVIESLPIMFRVHPDKRAIVARFNHAISILIQNGKMQRLTGIELNPAQ